MIRHLMCGMALTLLVASASFAQTAPDETAVRSIIQDEIAAWNQGDAVAYSRHFAADGTFTNITGQFFSGYDAFLKQHQVIFEGRFKQTTLQQDIVSLKFVRPDVAVVEVLTAVAGVVSGQLAQGTNADASGRLRTRLLQVVAKQAGEWKVVAYHNVDVKPGIPLAASLAAPASAAAQLPADLRAAMQARDTAFYAADAAQWEKYTAPAFTTVQQDGSFMTRAERLANLRTQAPRPYVPRSREQNTQRGDIVLARFFSGGLWVLEVWTRETGPWMVLMSQVTTAKP